MTQDQALTILKTGANVFLTGEPGSGKTHTVNAYVSYLREHGIEPSITASTGIAATHVGGMTIHSWSGIGVKTHLAAYDLEVMAEKESLVKRLRNAKVLIIDEISMLNANLLSMVDVVCRTLRHKDDPFGGLQVVLVGDFFQLPPVTKFGEEPVKFAFDSEAWKRANFVVCYLHEQHRQEDELYLQTLASIRRGDIGDHIYEHLETRRTGKTHEMRSITRLYTHNADVDTMNARELTAIQGNEKVFHMTATGNKYLLEGLKKNCLSPERLALKEGATVMFTKNNFEGGFVNGTLGTVTSFDVMGRPVVKTKAGKLITVTPMEWAIEDGKKILAKISQLPLRLAWAITVHKSQGMSMDAAVMDLGRAFEYGQGYVALSRVRTLDGVHLEGLNARALEVHPQVLEVDGIFRAISGEAEEQFRTILPDAEKKMNEDFIRAMGGVVKKPKDEGDESKGGKTEKDPSALSHIEKQRLKHPNAYKSWTKEDDANLTKFFGEGVSRPQLSKMFGRNGGAIRARLVHLGLSEEE